MGFKEQAERDVAKVFLNRALGELAEEHDINGRKAVCVIDQANVVPEYGRFTLHSANMRYRTPEMNAADRTLYIGKDFFEQVSSKPKVNMQIQVDGEQMKITDFSENRGLYEISLLILTR